jgi:hypothetical protein
VYAVSSLGILVRAKFEEKQAEIIVDVEKRA